MDSSTEESSDVELNIAPEYAIPIVKVDRVKSVKGQFNPPRMAQQRTMGSELYPELVKRAEENRFRPGGGTSTTRNNAAENVQATQSRTVSTNSESANTDSRRQKRPLNHDDSEEGENDEIQVPVQPKQEVKDPTSSVYYKAMYSKPTTKKHKTWEGDGFLKITGNGKEVVLRDEKGEVLTSAFNFKLPDEFGEDSQFQMGGKLIQVQESCSSSDVPKFSEVDKEREPPSSDYSETKQSSSWKRNINFKAPSKLPEGALRKSKDEPTGPSGEYLVLYMDKTSSQGQFRAWDADGTLIIKEDGKEVILLDTKGQVLVSVIDFTIPEKFGDGSEIEIGDKIIEICRRND